MIKICYSPNQILIILILGSFFLVTPNLLHAQLTEFEPEFYYQQSLAIQKTGMIVLSTWAGLNIFSGLTGNFKLKNDSKYFFQMNAAWNVVNLGIAAIGFSGIANTVIDVDTQFMFEEMRKFDRILLINAGLDILYIAAGSYLLNKGLNENKSRFIGYGRSVILQGGFLFLFDVLLYLVHSPNTKTIYQLTEKINVSATGFTIAF